MPLLNYTTKVSAGSTVGEIQKLLAKAGAEQVIVRYGKDSEPTSLLFELAGEMYILPCRSAEVHKKLLRDPNVPGRLSTPEQAFRVAWRILKDWVEAQVAIIQTGMVDAQEVMLPYMVLRAKDGSDQTVYENFREQRSERLLESKEPK